MLSRNRQLNIRECERIGWIGNSGLAGAGGEGCRLQRRMAFTTLVAPLLGADAESAWLQNRQVVGNGKAISWKEAAPPLPTAGLAARGQFNSPGGNGAHGASFAEVEVDIETGHVRVTKMCMYKTAD